jgi:hypothetical protein
LYWIGWNTVTTATDDTPMAKRKLKIGDKIRVTGYRPGTYAPGVEDEMGTENLFQSLVGRRYTIRGFDDYGNVELRPKPCETVWIEPDLVALVKKRRPA